MYAIKWIQILHVLIVFILNLLYFINPSTYLFNRNPYNELGKFLSQFIIIRIHELFLFYSSQRKLRHGQYAL